MLPKQLFIKDRWREKNKKQKTKNKKTLFMNVIHECLARKGVLPREVFLDIRQFDRMPSSKVKILNLSYIAKCENTE